MCAPFDDLTHTILAEAHSSRYSIHPGATKMYHDLRQYYWWSRIERDIVICCPMTELSAGKV